MNLLNFRGSVAAFLCGVLLTLLPPADAMAKLLPEGTLVLAMVMQVAGREEILATGEGGLLGQLHAYGVTDEQISDGSIAVGFVYCCGGKVSMDTRLLFYVPPDFRVAKADVVELALGRSPTRKQKKQGDVGVMNRAVRVRESFEDESGACRWDPENDKLWMRELYCDWMPGEGWLHRGGLSKGWYRPAPLAD